MINKEWTLQSEIKAHSSLISRVDWAHPIFGQIFAACLHNDIVAIYQEVIGENKQKKWSECFRITPPTSSPVDIEFSPRYFGLHLVWFKNLVKIRQSLVKMDLYIFINQPMHSKSEIGMLTLPSKLTNKVIAYHGVNRAIIP